MQFVLRMNKVFRVLALAVFFSIFNSEYVAAVSGLSCDVHTVINITSLLDTVGNDGLCTLREAITSANSDISSILFSITVDELMILETMTE